MNLYQYRISPRSVWRTPWHADTLSGRLCGVAAQLWGAKRLQSDLLDYFIEGMPPFVLSDAFPDGLLPIPIILKLRDWEVDERKVVKRARWLSTADFERARKGEQVKSSCLLSDGGFLQRERLQNTISRETGTTGDKSLFSQSETFLAQKKGSAGASFSLYARIESGFEDKFDELLTSLSEEGFGADAGTGYGSFCLSGKPELMKHWDDPINSDGLMALSTFQPAPNDPTEGYWEAFVKYGKLGPGFGLENIFKRPMIMHKPGACFKCTKQLEYLGGSLLAKAFLEPKTIQELEVQGVRPLHLAYGLTVPYRFDESAIVKG